VTGVIKALGRLVWLCSGNHIVTEGDVNDQDRG
jgi:hypothetical protein